MGSQDSKPHTPRTHSTLTRGSVRGHHRRNTRPQDPPQTQSHVCVFNYVKRNSCTVTHPHHPCLAGWTFTNSAPLIPSWPHQVLTSGDTDSFCCFRGSVKWNHACALLLLNITFVRTACRNMCTDHCHCNTVSTVGYTASSILPSMGTGVTSRFSS